MILLIITSAVNAWVYVNILILPHHILGPFYQWLEKMLTFKKVIHRKVDPPPEVVDLINRSGGTPVNTYKETIQTVKSKWLMPLGGCHYCVAGQLALWSFVAYYFLPGYSLDAFQVLRTAWLIITTICSSILLVKIIAMITGRGTN